MVSLWENVIFGEVVCLCVTRIVLRRACLCKVLWDGAARCGTRAVVQRCCARICWRRLRVYFGVPFRFVRYT